MQTESKQHWETIYETKGSDQLSWTQESPATSIKYFEKLHIHKDSPIIDIGGGESNFVDYLLLNGYTNISVLDISEKAIERAKSRLGDQASKVQWIVSDINDFNPKETYTFWHDRAAFHFLTSEKDIIHYVSTCKSHAENILIGTFSFNGPIKCSGLDITQYDEKSLSTLFTSDNIHLSTYEYVDHITPSGVNQNFVFCLFTS
jgi:SAM-dependent methyltransferase